MTWQQILRSDKPILTPQDISKVMGCHPQEINRQARLGILPFPCFRSGNRTKIPREGFIAWMRGSTD